MQIIYFAYLGQIKLRKHKVRCKNYKWIITYTYKTIFEMRERFS